MVQIDAADLEALKAELERTQVRYTLDDLVEHLATRALARTTRLRIYSPAETYGIGERIIFQGRPADVLAVRSAGNPGQGTFQVLELRLGDGTVMRVAASVEGAPLLTRGTSAIATTLSPGQVEALRQRLLSDPQIRTRLLETSGRESGGEAISLSCLDSRRHSAGLFAEHVVDECLGDAKTLDVELATRGPKCLALLNRMRSQGGISSTPVMQQTWRDLISPMLRVLGWRPLPSEDGISFALIPDLADPLVSRLPMCDADEEEPWVIIVPVGSGCGLDPEQAQPGSSGLPPVFHLVGALWEQRARWGILTDGVSWRLYASSRGDADVGSILSESYEVSLRPALEAPHSLAGQSVLRRWLGLFSLYGWSVGRDSVGLLDRIKRRTARYADAVTAGLQRVLWERVVPTFAGGFAAYLQSFMDPPLAPEELDHEILAAALTLSHLVVALLYMEHRHSLPVTDPDYRALSMTSLVHGAATALAEGRALSRSVTQTPRYQRLLDLLGLIREWGTAWHPFAEIQTGLASAVERMVGQRLSALRLSDEMLVRGLAPLAAWGGEAIDWSALTWRHLASALGGLAGSRLWVTDARAGQAALVDACGRRLRPARRVVPDSATIAAMDHALTSLLGERARYYRQAMDRRLRVRRGETVADQQADGQQVTGQRAALGVLSQQVREALLDIKILDPAMGAGGHLMAALDLLVDGVMAAVAGYYRDHPWLVWSEDPIYHALQSLTVDLRGQQVASVDYGDAARLTVWLCEHALYGVDPDPLAALLARQVFAVRVGVTGLVPIHLPHLWVGDSSKAVSVIDCLTAEPEITPLVREIWRKLSLWATLPCGLQADDERERSLGLWLDLLWAYHQRLDMAVGLIGQHHAELVAALQKGEELPPALSGELKHLQEVVGNQHPMFWEAAFPEVFLRRGPDESGFDAVIGSQPLSSESRASPNRLANAALVDYGVDLAEIGGAFAASVRRIVHRPGGKVALVIVPSLKERT